MFLSCWLSKRVRTTENYGFDNKENNASKHFRRSKSLSSANETKKSCKKGGDRSRSRIVSVNYSSVRTGNLGRGCLFGRPLQEICHGDCLPAPVMSMLQQLLAEGPDTKGIFRKSANARMVSELRAKLDAGETVTWELVPVMVTAALLKDFIRSLPDPLLGSALYPQWKDAIDTPNNHHKLIKIKGILLQLPEANRSLLRHFLCVLHHISQRATHNLMSLGNLAVCVGPSLLWADVQDTGLSVALPLADTILNHCQELYGAWIEQLMADRNNSIRRNASINGLECSPSLQRDSGSLSQDSGLTESDERRSSTSGSDYDIVFEQDAKEVRIFGSWEENHDSSNCQHQVLFHDQLYR